MSSLSIIIIITTFLSWGIVFCFMDFIMLIIKNDSYIKYIMLYSLDIMLSWISPRTKIWLMQNNVLYPLAWRQPDVGIWENHWAVFRHVVQSVTQVPSQSAELCCYGAAGDWAPALALPSYTAEKPFPTQLLLLRNSIHKRLSVEMIGSGSLSPQKRPGRHTPDHLITLRTTFWSRHTCVTFKFIFSITLP